MKNKKNLIILSIAFLLVSFIFSACKSTTANNSVSTTSATETVYTGYLIDQMCGVVEKDTSGKNDEKCAMGKDDEMKKDNSMKKEDNDEKVDFTKNPEKHTNACNKMPSCAKSGYGISIKQADGNYKYFKFDDTGSKLAKSEIVDKTKKKDNISVKVKGVLNNDTIKISSISEN